MKELPKHHSNKAAIYIRVSTHHQIDKDSLPFQRSELENYCKYALNIDDWVIFEDAGYSAKSTDRPQYQEMMTRIRASEFSHLIVWKLDRISRNLKDFTELWDELQNRGVVFVSKMEQFDTGNAIGEAMLRIILVFAELERKLTAERVFGLMISRAKKAQWNGAPVAIGYDWDEEAKTITINHDEAAIVQLIYDKYETYSSSFEVAKYLHENNYRTKRGGIWGSKGVIDILRNPIYNGTYRWNYRKSGRGEMKAEEEVISVEDALPAIISKEQWNRVQSSLDKNFRGAASNRQRTRHIHLLSGLIKCSYCGKNYIASRQTRAHKNGYHPSIYRCNSYVSRGECSNKLFTGLQIDPFVLEYIRAYVQTIKAGNNTETLAEGVLRHFGHPEIELIEIANSKGFDAILGGMDGSGNPHPGQQTKDKLDNLQKKKQNIERALMRLDDAYYFSEDQAAIKKSEYLVKRSEFQQKLNKIDADISSAYTRAPTMLSETVELTSRYILLQEMLKKDNLRDALPFLDKNVVKEFLNHVLSYVEVSDKKIIKIVFNTPSKESHTLVYRN